MRSLLILMLLAQPVMADYYLVNIPTEKANDLTVPLPPHFRRTDDGVWGIVKSEGKHTQAYVESSTDVVTMTAEKYRTLRGICGKVSYPCVQYIMDEHGNDQAPID